MFKTLHALINISYLNSTVSSSRNQRKLVLGSPVLPLTEVAVEKRLTTQSLAALSQRESAAVMRTRRQLALLSQRETVAVKRTMQPPAALSQEPSLGVKRDPKSRIPTMLQATTGLTVIPWQRQDSLRRMTTSRWRAALKLPKMMIWTTMQTPSGPLMSQEMAKMVCDVGLTMKMVCVPSYPHIQSDRHQLLACAWWSILNPGSCHLSTQKYRP